MRSYFFIEARDPRELDALPGCRFVAEAGRGQDPEMWFDDAVMPHDYPANVALLHRLPGTDFWQVAPLVDDSGALLKSCTEGAAKAGLTVYESAKALSVAQPAVADAHLYATQATVDVDGKPVGIEKAPGAKLQVAHCLVGDDAVACADTDAKVEAPAKPAAGDDR